MDLAFTTPLQGPLLGVLDVLCQFAVGKDRPGILKLNVREAENYLRDQNHVPAFSPESVAEGALQGVHTSLEAVVRGMGKVAGNLWGRPASAPIGTTGPGLAPMARAAQEILDRYVRPSLARDQGDVVLLKIADGVVYLGARGQCSGCPSSGAGTLQFIQEVFGREMGPGIRVVME